MKILAIDSSGLVASVAIVSENELIGEYTINFKKTHSQTLLPMLDAVVKMVELDLKDIDAIAVAMGPGSFTGLRIGSSTAKGLGLALDKPIIEVPTVDGLAYNIGATDYSICPLMDAKRNQVYTGIYEYIDGEFQVVKPECAVSLTDILDEINAKGKKVIFLGDGVPVYKNQITEYVKVPYVFSPVHLDRQRAGAIGALACRYYEEGKIVTARDHKPEYLRLSQAERELAEKNKATQQAQ
ncbi:tRNA threonylcarbamoyladenosine biosynthesis protein TsaB [Anaerosporobacter mobilis DSM 15930]|uniref:tRNA threonylcarbamoyladenosine biosynthesis protein TsaB n=1 Tax=Anaerosporobacter mobilis DSM 15930 TaxID=1120996 RepID=A0A1M7J6L9_9FIRM|nr:tRNA (adenosine(37)-N6)-threonylcarbamoyltransferase complex dimerization subunit type 1 TsaB [Anaerosporobacter mobilis]SHM48558.1 tRNA threonylcarbamoyladenosine biosynthesis protein TsaB [Anaerosporobacter mobilis DSM 15930]